MTPVEFVIWLKGFAKAANNFTLTPKQWDDIKEHLDAVDVQNVKPYWTVNTANNENTNTTAII